MWLQVKEGLLLDGTTSVEAKWPWNAGCWRKVSDCKHGFSVAVWINIEVSAGYGQDIISAKPFTSMTGTTFSQGWKLTVSMAGFGSYEMQMEVNDARGSGIQRTCTIDIPRTGLNIWRHYIFTYRVEGDNAELTGYVNGKSDGTTQDGEFESNGSTNNTDKLVFGNNQLFHGRLDELLIFDGVLDQHMVKLLYEHYHVYDI